MNCFLSGAVVRTGGSQPCIGGAPSAKYSVLAKKRYEREKTSHYEAVYKYSENDKLNEFDASELFSMDDED